MAPPGLAAPHIHYSRQCSALLAAAEVGKSSASMSPACNTTCDSGAVIRLSQLHTRIETGEIDCSETAKIYKVAACLQIRTHCTWQNHAQFAAMSPEHQFP